MQNIVPYFVICFFIFGTHWCIIEYLEQRRGRKNAEEQLRLANLIIKKQDECISMLEQEKTETIIEDYSIMAGLIEEHTTQLATIIRQIESHEGRLDQLGTIHIRIAPLQSLPEYDYCGPNECENDYDPYPEPTPMPEWAKRDMQDVEGLDAL